MTNTLNTIKNTLEDSLLKENLDTNISKTERILSAATGSYIFFKGIGNMFSHPLMAAGELAVGFALLNRGLSGHCALAQKMREEELKGPAPVLIVKETIVE